MSAWISGAQKYANMSAIKSPSRMIILSEASDAKITGDHFHPYRWTNDPELPGGPASWAFNTVTGETTELGLRRHLETFNVVYGDGHAKSVRWENVWFQNTANNIYEGAFDPRQ